MQKLFPPLSFFRHSHLLVDGQKRGKSLSGSKKETSLPQEKLWTPLGAYFFMDCTTHDCWLASNLQDCKIISSSESLKSYKEFEMGRVRR